MGLFTKNYMKYFPDGFELKTRLSSKVSEYRLYNNDQTTQWFIIGKIVNGELVTEGTEGGYTWGSMIFFNQFNEELKKVYALKNYCDTIGVQLAGLDVSAGWLATRDDLISGWSVEDNTENRQIYDDIFLRNGYSANPDASLIDKVRGFWLWLFDDLDASFDSAIEREDLVNPVIPAKLYDPSLVNTVKGDNDAIGSAVMNTSQNYGGSHATHEIDLSDIQSSIRELNQALFHSDNGFDWTYIVSIMETSNGHLWIYSLDYNPYYSQTLYLLSPIEISSSIREDPYVGWINPQAPLVQRGIYKDTGIDHPHGRPTATGKYRWYRAKQTLQGLDIHYSAEGTFSPNTDNLFIAVGGCDVSVTGNHTVGFDDSETVGWFSDIDLTDPAEYETLFEREIFTWNTIVRDNLWGFEDGGSSDSSVTNSIRDPLNSDGSYASQVGAGIIAGAINAIAPLFGVDENGDFHSTVPSITDKDGALGYLDDLSKNTGFFTGEPEEYMPALTWGANRLFTIWKITLAQLIDISNDLWTFDWTDFNYRTLISEPIDSMLRLTAYPFEYVGNTPILQDFHCAGKTFNDVGQCEIIPSVIHTFDCGKVKVSEYFKNFLDYNPYTQITAYLPFIGFVPINTDDVMNATIHLKYRIELLTGQCMASLTVERPNFKVTMYQFGGHMGIEIPITGTRMAEFVSGMLQMGVGMAMGFASLDYTPVSVGKGKRRHIDEALTRQKFEATNMEALGTMAEGVANTPKLNATRSGGMGGSVGMLANMQPYLIIERKIPRNSEAYSALNGRPSTDYVTIKNCSGYIQMSDVKLNNLSCNDSQKAQISALLRSGVFID